MGSSKRQRTPSRLSDDPSPSSPMPSEPINKLSRTTESSTSSMVDRAASLLCTLPPTCNPPHNTPTPIANSRDLEIHYAKYHAHVCEQRGCGLVFPEARLLELHQTECHDPLAAVRKERGEKIFACHLVSCPRLFLTPKARRLHLIQAHSYPKEYFFAVTNKGVGGLLKKWGDGASMVRGSWKPRENGKASEVKGQREGEMEVDSDSEEMEADDDDDDDEEEDEAGEATPKVRYNNGTASPAPSPKPSTTQSPGQSRARSTSGEVDGLAQSMTSLSLVPSSIRFGRGGKNGGFVHPELHNPQVSRGNFGPRGGRGRARIAGNVGGRMPRGATPVGGVPNGPAVRGGHHPRGAVRGGIIDIRGGLRGQVRGS
ncbi:hypothetical protein F5I97DRAFT_1934071 [Phlebopus sp. FC_14]|nr:hypothetical protein F5I97DRAFT_1934071 [Phlebopus sp. FC_14]